MKEKQFEKGLFVSLEGGEGSGKSTLIQHLKTHLENKGHRVMVTREPGGVAVAEDIRKVIMDNNMDSVTEALLFASARREHLVQKVIPALERGDIVLCDRFVHSSLVYQGLVRGLGVEAVWDINQVAIGGHMPDFTLFLDVEPEVGLMRIASNADREVNRWDKESLDFHYRVQQGYQALAVQYPEHRIQTINASGTEEEVAIEAIQVFDAALDAKPILN